MYETRQKHGHHFAFPFFVQFILMFGAELRGKQKMNLQHLLVNRPLIDFYQLGLKGQNR